MNFDPQKPFGKVFGLPGVVYTQGIYKYDARRKCVNPEAGEDIKPVDTVTDATAELRKKAAKTADKALLKLQAAKDALAANETPAAKSAYTKAVNAYNKAQEKLDSLSE